MNRDNKDNEEEQFDHNKAWQSGTVAKKYDQRRFTSIGGRAYDAMEQKCISSILDEIQTDAQLDSVLEVACGTGRISGLLAKREFELTCGDISEQMLLAAKGRLKETSEKSVEFTTLDIYDLEPFESKFDCVCCFRLFQHLTTDERARALREMARASRRFVLLNVMYTSKYYGSIRALRRALGRYTTRYTSSESEIAEELAYAGLRKIRSRFSQPGFNGNLIMMLEKT